VTAGGGQPPNMPEKESLTSPPKTLPSMKNFKTGGDRGKLGGEEVKTPPPEVERSRGMGGGGGGIGNLGLFLETGRLVKKVRLKGFKLKEKGTRNTGWPTKSTRTKMKGFPGAKNPIGPILKRNAPPR